MKSFLQFLYARLWFILYVACLIMLHASDVFPLTNNSPLCTIYTPNSVLTHKEIYTPHILDGRARYSTCTGAAWFHENYLAVLNLYGKSIATYRFNPKEKMFESLQTIGNHDGAALHNPENLAVSPDGTLLAVCSDAPNPGVQLFSIDTETHLINPRPIFSLPAKGLVHNVRFTPDNKYLALTGWDVDRAVCIYTLVRNESGVIPTLVHSISNKKPIKPKGINFTKDNSFAVVCYAPRVTKEAQQLTNRESLIVSYPFDASTGIVGEIISCKKIPSSAEDVAFLKNDTEIVMTDQAGDRLIFCPFNPKIGQIGDGYTTWNNPEARLSFPHGLGISHNGQFLAVTNYGDDTFNLYEVG